MKTIFTFKNGKTRVMGQRYATVLEKLGHGTYSTRELRAAPVYIPPVVVEDGPPAPVEEVTDELDSLDVDALRELAEARGVKVHHKAGADKIKAALRAGDGE